jgi:hypothetical protein
MTDEVKTNDEQELYIIPCGKGYTCLGFDVLLERSRNIAAWLRDQGERASAPPESKRGTMYAYHRYCLLLSKAQRYCAEQNTRCPVELTPQLIAYEGKQVEVVDCHGETRRFWVGKSTGWMPCHLEVKRSRNTDGCAVMGAPFKSVRVVRHRR